MTELEGKHQLAVAPNILKNKNSMGLNVSQGSIMMGQGQNLTRCSAPVDEELIYHVDQADQVVIEKTSSAMVGNTQKNTENISLSPC
jgi:hypothetical protein